MAREIEGVGIPVALISAVPSIPLNLGVGRVILGVAIPHLLGDPGLPPERERRLRRDLVEKAVEVLGHGVSEPTLFQVGAPPREGRKRSGQWGPSAPG